MGFQQVVGHLDQALFRDIFHVSPWATLVAREDYSPGASIMRLIANAPPMVAVIEVRTLIRRRFGAFARHHAKLGQTICAEHIFELERTNIEDGQRSILHGTAALVLIRTHLILDA